ncbi:thiol:disulfide interchange protein DsbA/DsbL [Roseateles sp. DAIF2]|uniref:thiol:disulfide interchange protein DsbA/DsbL n=1 Tax=Roseateles sp. DAIF2 TaxID=2714952 RepID=UPI0018A2A7F1|nr:thiol:disulfide interchange protein DsbA/DsbL [Roseateles sp. DAIF2]QPF76010.1 thiol:disulfide interchange protein DsbA/DsbL [Roseateles sp. DAIF2]
MKRRDFSTLAAGVVGGLSLPGLSLAQGGPQEGRHYQRLSQALPATPGKIEVVEFFWYGCPHCYAFEPLISDWAAKLPADVSFRPVHVAFRANVKLHQRLFYALEALGKEKEVRARVFSAMHRENKGLDSLKAMTEFLAPLGIEPAKFEQAYNSFGVQTKCLQAEKLSEAYRIDGVPAIGVGGRFLTSPAMATGGQRMSELESGQRALQTTDFLLQQLRGGKA